MSPLRRWRRRGASSGAGTPAPAPVAPDSALAHAEAAHRAVGHLRRITGRWLAGHIRLDAESAAELAVGAVEAAEHLRSFAALLPHEVADARSAAGLDPDDLTGGAL